MYTSIDVYCRSYTTCNDVWTCFKGQGKGYDIELGLGLRQVNKNDLDSQSIILFMVMTARVEVKKI